MPTPIISVENLSKRYLVGHRTERSGSYNYVALRDVLAQEMRNAARKAADVVRGRQVVQGDSFEEFWALRDVSFEVQQGEVLGIIGRNGAGKSTLLKLLSRITEPTEGRITLRGRVASLLEVGTGFHPELSGRENIYLNGAILGMSRAEIRKKFDEIVAFAEVEQFLDTPVKRYSSGMYVRLAFAVAAHLEPEILIVDEVLAVGDAEFQKKCIGKMSTIANNGQTIIVVSHNVSIVHSLCRKCLLLNRGAILEFGLTDKVLSEYIYTPTDRETVLENLHRPIERRDGIKLISFRIDTDAPAVSGRRFSATVIIEAGIPIRDVVFSLGFNTIDGQRLLTCDSDFAGAGSFTFVDPGRFEMQIAIADLPLGPSQYTLDVACRWPSGRLLDLVERFTTIEVMLGGHTSHSELAATRYATAYCPSAWKAVSNLPIPA